jgi:hypothetical protein
MDIWKSKSFLMFSYFISKQDKLQNDPKQEDESKNNYMINPEYLQELILEDAAQNIPDQINMEDYVIESVKHVYFLFIDLLIYLNQKAFIIF